MVSYSSGACSIWCNFKYTQSRGSNISELLYYCCSDILTPLPALGVPFEIDDAKGPIIADPVRSMKQVHPMSNSSNSAAQLSVLFMRCVQHAAGSSSAFTGFAATAVCWQCFDILETRSGWAGEGQSEDLLADKCSNACTLSAANMTSARQ